MVCIVPQLFDLTIVPGAPAVWIAKGLNSWGFIDKQRPTIVSVTNSYFALKM